MTAGTCTATITPGTDQRVKLVMGRDLQVKSISIDGAASAVTSEGISKYGTEMDLIKNKPAHLLIRMSPSP
jgi:hypothetical protein